MIEIVPVKTLNAEITVPGSKYVANRLIIISALANGVSVIKNVPVNDDIENAISILRKFGVRITKKNDALKINGTSGKLALPKEEINVGESGTLMRFIVGVSSLVKGNIKITGSKRIQERPIIDLLKSLKDLGVKSRKLNDNCFPVIIQGGSFKGGITKIRGDISSQYISSILLVAPYAENDVEIVLDTDLISRSYVDLTMDLMKKFNVSVERQGYHYFKVKSGQRYSTKEVTIPADWSSANYFFAAAAIVPGIVKIKNLDLSSKHEEAKFIDVLEMIGCYTEKGDDWALVKGNCNLQGVDIDMSSMPDSVQTLAAVACFANSKTIIRNIGHLKYKECDRIKDTATELRKLSVNVSEKRDELIIRPSKVKSGIVNSHKDHRMAMSLALIGLKKGVKIKNPKIVSKSFPGFWDKLNELSVEKKPNNIILIGYRGTGKTTLAKELSSKLNYSVICTDDEIRKKIGSINTFVKKNGWKKFREIESEIVQNIDAVNHIIDCGGGVVEDRKNIKKLKSLGKVFWLKAPFSVIKERIRRSNRPSLTGNSFIHEVQHVLERRMPLYEEIADYEINTNTDIRESLDKILKIIRKCKTCVSITANNINQAIIELKQAEKYADVVELRIDFMKDISKEKLKTLLENKSKEAIVTCRDEKEKGSFKGSENERISLLKSAIELGSDFVDVEYDSAGIQDILENKKNIKIIVSYHNFDETPSLYDLEKIYDRISELNPDLVKIVTFANSINDNFKIFGLLKNNSNLIAFCMGARGNISRILAPKYGSCLTYASLGTNRGAAPGQMDIAELEKVYNISLINPETKILGVIGEHAENSMSKHMHNANFRKLDLNYVYVPFKVRTDELKEFIENFRRYNFRGAAVTVPYKELVVEYIDQLDGTTQKIGATNTLVNNGKITGYNTDYYGAVEALKEKTNITNKNVLIVGGGGAARAIVYGLKKENTKITVINRTFERAKRLANEFNIKCDKIKNIKNLILKNEIIINTTSLGMNPNPNGCIIKKDDLKENKIIMDIVYNPVETKLIKIAKEKNCEVIAGDRMLIYQAIQQFKLWTNIKPDFKEMEKALLEGLLGG